MYQYTKDNHFKFGYNGNWFVDKTSIEDNWSVIYGRCQRTNLNFRDECVKAASIIWEQRDGLPIDILFSGGIDSEIVLRSFVETKVPINVNIIEFDNFLNAYDVSFAKSICNNLNITPIIHKLDVEKFWKSGEYLQYSDISKAVSPQILTHMWLMNKLDGLPILGSGDNYTVRVDIAEQKQWNKSARIYTNVDWVLVEREKFAAWYRYAFKQNRPAVPAFFQYTPELMMSMLTDPKSTELHNNKIKDKLSSLSSKFDICKKYWPELITRQKSTGFELLYGLDRIVRKKLRETNGIYEYEYWSKVTDIIKYMNNELIDMPKNLSPFITNPCSYRKDTTNELI